MSAGGVHRSFVTEPGPPGTRFSEVRRFAELDSTNRYLVDEARAGARAWLVAVAEHQTAGRGRLGRRWEAPPAANLLASVLLTPELAPDQLHLCSVAVALSAAEACRQGSGLVTELKWPNDLLVGEHKVAGILAESVPLGERSAGGRPGPASAPGAERRAVVVGVGVNLAWPPPEGSPGSDTVPDELRHIATSVWRETGSQVGAREILGLLLADLDGRLADLDDVHGRLRLAQEYRARCSTLGRAVRVVLADDEVRGTAVDITPEGHLVVDVGACFTTVTAGDVVHVHRGG